jgi:hypothetical protein
VVDELSDGDDVFCWELEESEAVGLMEGDAGESGLEGTARFRAISGARYVCCVR